VTHLQPERSASGQAAPLAFPLSDRVRAHILLAKPRIIELLLATAVPTAFLAAEGLPSLRVTLAIVIGGTLAAGAASSFNSVYDRDIDAHMARTRLRPAVAGKVSVRAGVTQGILLSVASIAVLLWLANLVAALLAALAIGMYAVGYTILLKRRTSQNIVWGGAAGCMPILIAWSAVRGSVSLVPVLLFLIVFFWTPPHYWPLAIRYREEYAAAGVPMLPVVRPLTTACTQTVVYAVLSVLVSLILIPLAPMGFVYSIAAVVLGVAFIALVIQLRLTVRRFPQGGAIVDRAAMRVFHGSITYLALLFLAVALDPFVG
jgi:protoheme IX farnesyltransferase